MMSKARYTPSNGILYENYKGINQIFQVITNKITISLKCFIFLNLTYYLLRSGFKLASIFSMPSD